MSGAMRKLAITFTGRSALRGTSRCSSSACRLKHIQSSALRVHDTASRSLSTCAITRVPVRGARAVTTRSTGGSTSTSTAAAFHWPMQWSISSDAPDARPLLTGGSIRIGKRVENSVQRSCSAKGCSAGNSIGKSEEQRHTNFSQLSKDEVVEVVVSNLESRTQRLFLELPQLSPPVRHVQMIRLIWDWSHLWGHGTTTPPSYISRGAVLTEKLVHALLDAKEEHMNICRDVGGKLKTEFGPLCVIAIIGLSRSDIPKRGRRAQSILDRVEVIFDQSGGLEELAPTSKMYNATIFAYSKSDEVAAIDNCLSLLRRMEDRFASGKNKLVKPKAIAYNSVLDAFARRGDAHNAQRLIEEMERLHARSNDEAMMPDKFSFSSLIHAWEKSCHPSAAKRAEETLQKMMDIFNSSGNRRVLPNQVTFGVCMALYANNPNEKEGALNAERILDWLVELFRTNDCDRDLSPNASHFVTVMNGHARSRGRQCAIRAENILTKMEDLYSETGCDSLKPNHKCFVICIKAWVRSKQQYAAKNAERLLNRMESLFLDSVDPSERMNNYAFNIGEPAVCVDTSLLCFLFCFFRDYF